MCELAERWRTEAERLRGWGASEQATVLETCAGQLEAHTRQQELEALTLEDAAEASGYSYSSLQKKVAGGELANVGTKGSPRVRRGDLPRKARAEAPESLADTIVRRRWG